MSSVRGIISRRAAITWILKAAAAGAVAPKLAFGDSRGVPIVYSRGYGLDPDLRKNYTPGELWPLILSQEQRVAATALCDEIMPADNGFPPASAVGVVDFVDEWISAPYEAQRSDRALILRGLKWIDKESTRRFGMPFSEAGASGKAEICDAICSVSRASAGLEEAAKFFSRYRDLVAGAYYSSPAGFKDLGYVGNIPQASFDGPPEDVLRKAGLL
jgi:hypothetical protein